MIEHNRTYVNDISRLRTDNGWVLVKVNTEPKKTKTGIIVGFNPDTLYSTGEDDRSSHPADVAEVKGTVIKVPDKLIFEKSDYSMDWETEIEIKEGDEVWFNYLDSLNADEVNDMKLIPYQSIYFIKRDEIIPVNGYCLFEIPEPEEPWMKKDHSYGIVWAVGKPNKKYQYKEWRDGIDLKKGDKVRFSSHVENYPVYIERVKELAELPMLIRAQRKDILAVL